MVRKMKPEKKRQIAKADTKVKRKSYKKSVLVNQEKIKNNRHNYSALAGVAVIVLLVVISITMTKASNDIEGKIEEYDKQISIYNQKLEEEKQRGEELKRHAVEITTKQFIIEFAREKLGLVFEDEIIFRPDEE